MLIDVAVYTQEAEAGGWGISGQVELWTETLSLKAKEKTGRKWVFGALGFWTVVSSRL